MASFEKVLDTTLTSNNFTYTDWFSDSNLLFIESPYLEEDEGIEVAAALNIELVESESELPVLSWGEKELPLEIPNILDTNQLVILPYEAKRTKLRSRVILYPAYPFYVRCYAVKDTLPDNNQLLEEIKNKISEDNQEQIDQLYSTILDAIELSGGDVTAVPSLLRTLNISIEGLPLAEEQPELPSSYDINQLINMYAG